MGRPRRAALAVLFLVCGAEAAAVRAFHVVNFHNFQRALVGLDAELAQPLAGGDVNVMGSVDGPAEDVALTAVGLVDDANGVGLEQTELLEAGAARRHDGFIAGGNLDTDAQVNQAELAGLEVDFLDVAAIHPLAGVSLCNRPSVIAVVFDKNFVHK